MVKRWLWMLLAGLVCVSPATADRTADGPDVRDPLDPFDVFPSSPGEPGGMEDPDAGKTAMDLIRDATLLLADERPLDARTKLLKAIQRDPREHKAYYLLAGYYMVHVGHFRLALKYIKRAQELFEEKNGPPPYASELAQLEHAGMLYYLSQIRLNLDNYQGALEALDDFQKYKYYDDWYPGSRAWVLMKLGRVQEAIKIARLGVLGGAEPGRTLNMLGILLSMTDQRDEALDIFRQAIGYELALGTEGQPATPLNNAGEVYKEIFQEEKAEQAWLRATGLPDGCEHVLPSLNLALLTIDQLRFRDAKQAMDSFESCVAQYPLRNGEEHRALVHLARGRISLHTGFVDDAIKHFEASLEGIQWFGKIGTSQDDLKAGAMISLAQALRRKNNLLDVKRYESWSDWFSATKEAAANRSRAWWLLRRTRQLLTEDLNDIEDLSIRNTDSMIEYPTLGEVLAGLPKRLLITRLDKQLAEDGRFQARVFYNAYKAEALDGWFDGSESDSAVADVLKNVRPDQDDLLFVHVAMLRLSRLDEESTPYIDLAYRVFEKMPAAIRNYGHRLPVRIGSDVPEDLRDELADGPFVIVTSSNAACEIHAKSSTEPYGVKFSCSEPRIDRFAEGGTVEAVVNKLADAVFRVNL